MCVNAQDLRWQLRGGDLKKLKIKNLSKKIFDMDTYLCVSAQGLCAQLC